MEVLLASSASPVLAPTSTQSRNMGLFPKCISNLQPDPSSEPSFCSANKTNSSGLHLEDQLLAPRSPWLPCPEVWMHFSRMCLSKHKPGTPGKPAIPAQKCSYLAKVFKVCPYSHWTFQHHLMHLRSCIFIQVANLEDPSQQKEGKKGLNYITGAWARAYLLHLILGI